MRCIFLDCAKVLVVALFEKTEVSISLCLPEAIRWVDQNGCLSAADLKWGYDGDISGHVCENTITSMSRLNHSPLCNDSPPSFSPHLQCWSPVHVVAVYHSQRRETHWAVMDGPEAKTAPIAYQLPISTLLAGCQCAPHPGQVNEIRCKCRYNGAFCCIQITQRQVCSPPVGSVSRWMREKFWEVCVCVALLMRICVCTQDHVHVMRQSGDFPDSFAQWKPSCLPVYLFALLIADHTSYVTPPRILQVNLSLTRSAVASAAGQYNLGGEISLHTGTRTSTITHSHTHRWGDSDGWHYCSCVAPNGLLKWLIKGKQLLHRGTDGATPPTEAGTQASEENTTGVWLSAMALLLLKL